MLASDLSLYKYDLLYTISSVRVEYFCRQNQVNLCVMRAEVFFVQ